MVAGVHHELVSCHRPLYPAVPARLFPPRIDGFVPLWLVVPLPIGGLQSRGRLAWWPCSPSLVVVAEALRAMTSTVPRYDSLFHNANT